MAETQLTVSADGIDEAITKMRLLPEDIKGASRYAAVHATRYAKREAKRLFRKRTGISPKRSQTRIQGRKTRLWIGGSSIPTRHIKGGAVVRRGKIFVRQYAGQPNTVQEKGLFVLNVPGKPIYRRVGKGKRAIEIVYVSIAEETYKVADDILPGVKDVLEAKFRERAEKYVLEGRPSDRLAHKGSVEDRLSGIKYLRTNVR